MNHIQWMNESIARYSTADQINCALYARWLTYAGSFAPSNVCSSPFSFLFLLLWMHASITNPRSTLLTPPCVLNSFGEWLVRRTAIKRGRERHGSTQQQQQQRQKPDAGLSRYPHRPTIQIMPMQRTKLMIKLSMAERLKNKARMKIQMPIWCHRKAFGAAAATSHKQKTCRRSIERFTRARALACTRLLKLAWAHVPENLWMNGFVCVEYLSFSFSSVAGLVAHVDGWMNEWK